MPRNPNKTRCIVPGCNAWTMRGRTRCRPHLDDVLGPRGAGVPKGNLNALRHGRYSQPLISSKLERLVAEIIAHPDDIHNYIAAVAKAAQARDGDPYKTLVVLRTLLQQLTPLFAYHLFFARLCIFIKSIPPSHREATLAVILRECSRFTAEEQLLFLEKLFHIWNNYRCRESCTSPATTDEHHPDAQHRTHHE